MKNTYCMGKRPFLYLYHTTWGRPPYWFSTNVYLRGRLLLTTARRLSAYMSSRALATTTTSSFFAYMNKKAKQKCLSVNSVVVAVKIYFTLYSSQFCAEVTLVSCRMSLSVSSSLSDAYATNWVRIRPIYAYSLICHVTETENHWRSWLITADIQPSGRQCGIGGDLTCTGSELVTSSNRAGRSDVLGNSLYRARLDTQRACIGGGK